MNVPYKECGMRVMITPTISCGNGNGRADSYVAHVAGARYRGGDCPFDVNHPACRVGTFAPPANNADVRTISLPYNRRGRSGRSVPNRRPLLSNTMRLDVGGVIRMAAARESRG